MPITHLFLDIGGVLLTNGWDHESRKRATAKFRLKLPEIESRHRLIFEIFEEGRISLEEYLNRVIFYQKRPFTRVQFRNFMFAQSKSYPSMIRLITKLKKKYRLRIFIISNEAKELNSYRIRKFKLNQFVDSFISSSFVGMRKPNSDIFRLALDLSQANHRQVVYIENTPMFVEVAEQLGIQTILHKEFRATRSELAQFGLSV